MTQNEGPNVIPLKAGNAEKGQGARKVIVTDRRLGRMKARMAEKQISQSALAEMVGITPGAVSLIFSGKTQRTGHFPAIARALEVDLGWLLGVLDGEFDEDQVQLGLHLSEKVSASVALLKEVDLQKLYQDFHCGIPVTARKIAFSLDILALYTAADPAAILVAQGIGDGMLPTLTDSDLLLIDASRQRFDRTDRIWLVRYAGLLAVKRLRPIQGGIKMVSDNPVMPDQDIPTRDVEILGLIVGCVRKV